MSEKKDKTELTDDQLTGVTGGTGTTDDTYDDFRQHTIDTGEGDQRNEDCYDQLDNEHIGGVPVLSHASQTSPAGLQPSLGNGLAPSPAPEPGPHLP